MADEPHVLRGINWRDAFPFTHIFRSFRIAIHPSKMVLALAALLTLYIGGRILDAVWPTNHRAIHNEVSLYEATFFGRAEPREEDTTLERVLARFAPPAPDATDFAARRQHRRETVHRAVADLFLRDMRHKTQEELVDFTRPQDRDRAERYMRDNPRRAAAHIEYELKLELEQRLTEARKHEDRATRERELRNAFGEDIRVAAGIADRLRGQGIFVTFFNYQTTQINNTVAGIISLNFIEQALPSLINFFVVGPAWLATQHWVFLILFGLLFLGVWAIFGGAIARIAAVQVADEGRKLSVRQGLGFSVSKFLSFLSAPLIPLVVILAMGLAIALAVGAIFWIPGFEIVVALLFFLVLIVALIMTLSAIGLLGGINLMYPTIAVEGSDSFDALSRSFSYVYQRPWRMLFYTLVALIYGAITYLFVRLFIFLTLWFSHVAAGALARRRAEDWDYLWNRIFPQPSFERLPYEIDFLTLGTTGSIAAVIMAFWVYLLVALLGAFAISFYFSANTVIYYLMRREVDATEMDDVYLEQPEEEFVETPPATIEPTPAPAGPAGPAPGTEPVGGEAPDAPRSAEPGETTGPSEEAPGESPRQDQRRPDENPPPAQPGA